MYIENQYIFIFLKVSILVWEGFAEIELYLLKKSCITLMTELRHWELS